tara:strand:+ start:1047 stop:1838 length:792 start_codon:yes stop_codon:yes gene_type:complete
MFYTQNEKTIYDDYLKNGYFICDIRNSIDFKKTDFAFKKTIAKELLVETKIVNDNFLNNFHKHISKKKINSFRINIINKICKKSSFKQSYYFLCKEILDLIVGNELVMQKNINLSIQLPKDQNSLLSIHSDTLSGDSSFEVVAWLPFVDCYKTKSMYILNPKDSQKLHEKMKSKKIDLSHKKIFNLVKNKVKFIKIKKGQVLIFNQNLFHGNVVNMTNETRWSMNCRFKSLFSPYKNKLFAEFFEPINTKPATIDGINFDLDK